VSDAEPEAWRGSMAMKINAKVVGLTFNMRNEKEC
jgi:hypothetical protein